MGYYIQPKYAITKPDIDYEGLANSYTHALDADQVQHIKDIVNDICGAPEEPTLDIIGFIEWLKDEDDDIL